MYLSSCMLYIFPEGHSEKNAVMKYLMLTVQYPRLYSIPEGYLIEKFTEIQHITSTGFSWSVFCNGLLTQIIVIILSNLCLSLNLK